MPKRFAFLAFALFLVLSWLLPHHYAPWMAAFQDSLAIAAILVLALSYGLSGKLKFPSITILFFAVLPIPLIQAFTGLVWFWGDGWVAFLYLTSFCLAFLVGFNAADQRGEDQRLLSCMFICIIIGATLSLVLASRQWLQQPAGVWGIDIAGPRPSGNMAQPNNYASLLCMAVFGVLYFFERRLIGKTVTVLMVILLLFGVALGQSRTSWVVALFSLGAFLYGSRIIRFRLQLSHLVVGAAVYVSFVVLLPVVSDLLLLSSTELADRVRATARLDLYQMFAAAVLKGGLWGYGWTQVAIAQLGVALEYPLGLRVSQSHNLLLDMLLWNGPVIGGGIILLMGVWLTRLCYRIETSSAFCGVMAFLCLLIHAMLELPLEYAFFLMPAGLLLGLVCGETEESAGFIPKWVALVAVVLVSVVGGRAVYEYVQLEDEYRQVRMESVGIIPREKDRVLPKIIILDQIESMVKVFRMDVRGGLSKVELEFIGKTAHRYPNHYLLNFYALNLAENGCMDMAFDQVELIKALYGEEKYFVTKGLVETAGDFIFGDQRYRCAI